ncbi:MAG: B12-binding domain-containing radical SAM protein [Nitrospinota bacterium]
MGLSFTLNHGVTALSAAIKEQGHEVSLLHLETFDLREVTDEIIGIDPDVIGISLTENHSRPMMELSEAIKQKKEKLIFWGGAFPSAYPAVIENFDHVDGICLGEGERSFLQVLENIEKGKNFYNTRGFWFRDKNTVIKNENFPIISDLDDLPFPDYSIFSERAVYNCPAFSFSRGCPFKCTYCCSPLYVKRDMANKRIRHKSPQRAIMEIKQFLEKYDPPAISINDDTFLKSRKWAFEFLEIYQKEIKKPFRCNSRPETIKDDILKKMKEAGCEQIMMGIESGDEEVRNRVLGRGMKNSTIVEAFALVKKYGIRAPSFNMVGFPGDSPKSFKKTIELNQKLKPDNAQITIFYPYRGTFLGDKAYEEALVVGESHYSYVNKSILSLPGFSTKQIERAAMLFKFRLYLPLDFRRGFLYLMSGILVNYPKLYKIGKKIKTPLKKYVKWI